jgi:hypothetical protein
MALARVKPEVLVTARLSLSQMGCVTYLATSECVDLISGKGSDMLEISEAGGRKLGLVKMAGLGGVSQTVLIYIISVNVMSYEPFTVN